MGTISPRTIDLPRAGRIVLRSPEEWDVAAWIEYELSLFGADPHKVADRAEFDARPEHQWSRLREHVERPGGLVIPACPAEDPGRIIGDVMFQNGKMRKLEHQGHFGIAVAADYRGTGVGSAMMGVMLDWAAAHPLIEKLALGVWAANTGAIRMYTRHGFREEGRRLRFFRREPGEYVDDVQMAIWVKPGLAPPGFNTYRPADGATA